MSTIRESKPGSPLWISKTKLDENEDHPVYSTLEGLVQAISEHGKSMSKDIGKFYEKIKIDFHRVKITWTKENGYEQSRKQRLYF